jgi:formate dehydrogenase major subunit
LIDLKNADVIFIIGSNAAENHPIAMKWALRAKERGAKLIVADPRFTKTAAAADIHVPFRSGADIALLGGMIRYILENNLYFPDYVLHYTNASYLVDPEFMGPGELDGVFSGFDEKTGKYDMKSWSFQSDDRGVPLKDLTLEDPRCVFQLLKKHYSRYTIEMVSSITGASEKILLDAYKTFGSTGRAGRAGAILYCMGATQHSVGVQNVRCKAIIQLLLGNMGMAGGGLNALRGECNGQGAPDNGIFAGVLPGYMPTPSSSLVDLRSYVEKHAPACSDPMSINWWANRDRYIVSYLKALYGDKAVEENDFAYSWLPGTDEGMDVTAFAAFGEMLKHNIQGFFCWAYNPACSGSDADKIRKALSRLQWMVCVDIFDSETASFWRGPGMSPEDIGTEVFLLPASTPFETEGDTTTTGRVLQWKDRAIEPVGESKPVYEIINKLYFGVKKCYRKEGGVCPEPVVYLTWNYGEPGAGGEIENIDVRRVAREINGYYLEDVFDPDASPPGFIGRKGQIVIDFTHLRADGTTACGNWLYSGSHGLVDGEVVNLATRRGKADPGGLGLFPEWGWSWPLNRRVLYNRASVDLEGNPWDPRRPILKWDPVAQAWEGDVPDGNGPPMAFEGGKYPFIMKIDGRGHIFGPLADGPFPEHYEPLESPLAHNLLSRRRTNPAAKCDYTGRIPPPEGMLLTGENRYPFVCTTIRVQEHYESGSMTRRQPRLAAMQPGVFVEMSEELAEEKAIKSGEEVIVSSARGELPAAARVTGRLKPFVVGGFTIHLVALPWCFGWRYPENSAGGDSANLLTPWFFDPNAMEPEVKAFMVNISKRYK